MINYNTNELLKVNGIGKSKLKQVVESYGEVVGNRNTIMFLQSLDVGSGLINRIIRKYGKRTEELITKNPYRLYDEVDGIGFIKADAIAEKMGVEKDSVFRIRSYIKHHLYEVSNNGSSFLYRKDLVEIVSKILGLPEETIENEIEELLIKGDLIKETVQKERIYLANIYYAETQVAGKLVAINSFNANRDINHKLVGNLLKDFQSNQNIVLNELQKEAVLGALKNKITVITGGPGTGKTTIVDAILNISENFDLKVFLTAPTGRAAKRMEESTGQKAKTIHRLLEYQYIEDMDMLTFNKNEEDPLSADLVIVDEFSMIDINLLNHLLSAITVDMRLVMIGDIDQLPSIGPGNALKDIIESNIFGTVRLTEIYRQGKDSNIVLNAHRINHGEMPLSNNQESDFFLMSMTNQKEILNELVKLVSERLPSYYNIDPVKDIQIISPIKNGILGTRKLNEMIQNTLNPPSEDKTELVFQYKYFREGDKVMQFKNNYSIKWIDVDTLIKGEGIFNGEIGYIHNINPIKKNVKVIFDEYKEVTFEYKDLKDLDLSYAITIHKAQGSEFKCIVIPISFIPPKMMSRNLLYTAVTRGKDLVVILGDKKYLNLMINSQSTDERNSGLIHQFGKFETVLEK